MMDIAIQTTGTLESLFEVAALYGLRINEEPQPGTEIIEPAEELKNKKMLQGIKEIGLQPATLDDPDLMAGIGYWAIEEDFEVQ